MPLFMYCYSTIDRFHFNLAISAYSKTWFRPIREGIISSSLF